MDGTILNAEASVFADFGEREVGLAAFHLPEVTDS